MTETWLPSVDGVVTRLRATLDSLHHLGHHTLVIAPGAPGLGGRRGGATATGGGNESGQHIVSLPAMSLPFVAGGRPFGMPLSGRVSAALEEFGADIVHVVNPFLMARAGVTAARRLGLPLVASFHQDLAMVARHMRLGIPDDIVWGYTRRRRQNSGRLALWPCGVDAVRFHPGRRSPKARQRLAGAAAGRTVVLYTGRLAPEKGLHRLYPLARDRDVLLVVAGDGPERPRMERDLTGCSVRFTGWLSGEDLTDAYAGADVFVFPSITETLGLSLIEALAAGLPALAADSPTTREILGSDGGTTVPVREWDATVADTARWLGGPGREMASHRARERVAQWDWTDSTRQLTDLYARVLRRSCSVGAE